MLVATGVFMSSCSSDDSNKQQEDPYKEKWKNKTAKYTVMLYGCGGGDVDEQLDHAIDYVKNSLNVNNNQVRFVVMYSTSKTDQKQRSAENPNQPVNLLYGRWGCTYRYELTPGITQENFHERCYYKPASEVELYRVETIKEFINWRTHSPGVHTPRLWHHRRHKRLSGRLRTGCKTARGNYEWTKRQPEIL